MGVRIKVSVRGEALWDCSVKQGVLCKCLCSIAVASLHVRLASSNKYMDGVRRLVAGSSPTCLYN